MVDKLRLRLIDFLPLVLGLLGFAIGTTLLGRFGLHELALVADPKAEIIEHLGEMPTATQVTARYAMAAAFLTFLIAGLVVVIQALRQIAFCLKDRMHFTLVPPGWVLRVPGSVLLRKGLGWLSAKLTAHTLVLVTSIILLLGLVGYLEPQVYQGRLLPCAVSEDGACVATTDDQQTEMVRKFAPAVFANTLGRCNETGCLTESDAPGRDEEYFLWDLRKSIVIGNVLAAVAAFLMAVAASCLVIRAFDVASDDPDARVVFARLGARWKNLLYFTSLFLVTSVLHMNYWRSWPAAYLPDDAKLTMAFEAAVKGTVLYEGILYSIILFLTFVTAATLMGDAYEKAGLEPEVDKGAKGVMALPDFKNMLNIGELAKTMLAIIAPAASAAAPIIEQLLTGAPQ